MNLTERKILEILDSAVNDENIAGEINTIVQRVEKQLENNPNEIMAWEGIPLELYNYELPEEIKSSWVFILRKNLITGAERHPNSIQRMVSYKGYGDFQTKPGDKWESNYLESDSKLPLEKRWISIPVNVWHQGVVPDKDWVVVSFHTAGESELIEERPVDESSTEFRREKYADKPLNK